MRRFKKRINWMLALAVVALLGAAAAGHALVATSSTNYRINNGAVVGGGAELESTNFKAQASRVGPANFKLKVSSITGVPPDTAVISSSLVTAGPLIAGDSFDVMVEVSSNTTGLIPSAGTLRVNYPFDSVTLDSVTGAQLGPALLGPEEGTAPNVFKDVSNLGDVSNTDSTPEIFTLTFTVNPGAASPFDIVVGDDPEASLNLPAVDITTEIPHTFDNTGVTGLTVEPPASVGDWKQLDD